MEITQLLCAASEAFDHVIGAKALAVDSSLKGRMILRMKRKFVLEATKRSIDGSVCMSVEDVAEELVNESVRHGCIPAPR